MNKVNKNKKVTRSRPVKSKSKKPPQLIFADNYQAFWVHDGPMIRSLHELQSFLKIITLEQFVYHTKREGNDFANWVEAVLKNIPCAKKLRRATTPGAALAAVTSSLKSYDG